MTAVQWREVRVGDRFLERGVLYEVQSIGSEGDEVRIAARVVQSYWLRRPAGGWVDVERRPSRGALDRLTAMDAEDYR